VSLWKRSAVQVDYFHKVLALFLLPTAIRHSEQREILEGNCLLLWQCSGRKKSGRGQNRHAYPDGVAAVRVRARTWVAMAWRGIIVIPLWTADSVRKEKYRMPFPHFSSSKVQIVLRRRPGRKLFSLDPRTCRINGDSVIALNSADGRWNGVDLSHVEGELFMPFLETVSTEELRVVFARILGVLLRNVRSKPPWKF